MSTESPAVENANDGGAAVVGFDGFAFIDAVLRPSIIRDLGSFLEKDETEDGPVDPTGSFREKVEAEEGLVDAVDSARVRIGPGSVAADGVAEDLRMVGGGWAGGKDVVLSDCGRLP